MNNLIFIEIWIAPTTKYAIVYIVIRSGFMSITNDERRALFGWNDRTRKYVSHVLHNYEQCSMLEKKSTRLCESEWSVDKASKIQLKSNNVFNIILEPWAPFILRLRIHDLLFRKEWKWSQISNKDRKKNFLKDHTEIFRTVKARTK